MGGGPEPVAVLQETQKTARATTADAVNNRRLRPALVNLCKINATGSHAMHSGNTCRGIGGGKRRSMPDGRELESEVVITKTVEAATFEPSMLEEAGATVQVDAIGTPAQFQVIV